MYNFDSNNIKRANDPEEYKNAIIESIKQFESKLDAEHEIALKLTTFGQSIVLEVTNIGFRWPNMIYFYGLIDGQPAELIQNINVLNFLITSAKKKEPEKPARRIGF
jgi:hypothetical protein